MGISKNDENRCVKRFDNPRVRKNPNQNIYSTFSFTDNRRFTIQRIGPCIIQLRVYPGTVLLLSTTAILNVAIMEQTTKMFWRDSARLTDIGEDHVDAVKFGPPRGVIIGLRVYCLV